MALGTRLGDPMLARKEATMPQIHLMNPLDAEYAEHREAEERRRQTREWLKQRERELGFVKDAPPVAPDNNAKH